MTEQMINPRAEVVKILSSQFLLESLDGDLAANAALAVKDNGAVKWNLICLA